LILYSSSIGEQIFHNGGNPGNFGITPLDKYVKLMLKCQ